jgi:hypothetical protein
MRGLAFPIVLALLGAACSGAEVVSEPSRPPSVAEPVAPPVRPARPTPPRAAERERMVRTQIEARGVKDEAVLRAMRAVPRHEFVPEAWRRYAYSDTPLEIGMEQTISQPFIVGSMTQAARVKPTDRVLEIGTGSGYQARPTSRLRRSSSSWRRAGAW